MWSESDLVKLTEWLGITAHHLVMLRDGATDKVSVWYDAQDISRVMGKIAEKINSDGEWFPRVKDSFQDLWQKLFPYLNEEQELKTLADLKHYCNWWAAWWSPMAILFEIPNISSLPQEVRDAAFAIRAETQDFSDLGEEVIDQFFAVQYPKLEPLWRLMTPDELSSPDRLTEANVKNIKERAQGWGLVDGELVAPAAIPARLAERGLELEEIAVDGEVKEIKGQPACRGHARGKVRLILDSKSIYELQDREILVTEMTTPEYVPAMKKSAAIVTDEGGVTCHAAIVSRELNKPCIIGTKIATQVLKDGDEVEVDAEQGIVRKL